MDGEQSGVWRESVVVPREPSRVDIAVLVYSLGWKDIVDLHRFFLGLSYTRQIRIQCHYNDRWRNHPVMLVRVGSREYF